MAKLFDLDSYLDKAERLFLLRSQQHFSMPIRITVEIKKDPRKLEEQLSSIPGVTITRFSDRKAQGLRTGIPSEISFDAAFLLKRRPILRDMKADLVQAIKLASKIDMNTYVERNLADVKRRHHRLSAAVSAAEFLLSNTNEISGLFPRQIPHGQSTKLLIEETLVRRIIAFHLNRPQLGVDEFCGMFNLRQKPTYFHIYAEKIVYDGFMLERHHSIITELNVDRFDFAPVKRVLIVENEETFHAIHNRFEGLVIHGHGDKAASLGFIAAKIENIPTYYWGDIDKAGYEAFAHVYDIIPQVTAVGMKMDTILEVQNIWQSVEKVAPTAAIPILEAEYNFVCSRGIMVEQEQIPVDLILKKSGITRSL